MSAALSANAVVPDIDELNKDLDKTKSRVFYNSTAAFYAPLMCSLDFIWDSSIDTAATDGVSILWSPKYYWGLPKDSRKTDLMHELMHVALLHMIRRGSRDHQLFNIACDIKIDLMLLEQGYTFEGIEGVLTWPGLNARQYAGWIEEDIYDDLYKRNPPQPPPTYTLDIRYGDKDLTITMVGNVIRAIHIAKQNGCSKQIPDKIEKVIESWLAPVVPWEKHLHRFMTEMTEDAEDSWGKPNRRYLASSIYLPSMVEDEGKLTHLMWYEDVSGSILDVDNVRFNSEMKHVHEVFKPDLMTITQFDDKITQVKTVTKDERFEKISIIGRGGTNLEPVRQDIIKHKPTAVIIFSDLECAPMRPLPFPVPVLWVAIRNRSAIVPFGKLIHIHKE